jgi:hypothetical protein
MTDATKLDNEVQQLKKERHNWKMGLEYKSLNESDFNTEMQSKFDYLYTASKTLFKSVINDDMDEEKYQYMLNMLKLVNNETLTKEKASEQIGQDMFKEYVDPLLKKEKNM